MKTDRTELRDNEPLRSKFDSCFLPLHSFAVCKELWVYAECLLTLEIRQILHLRIRHRCRTELFKHLTFVFHESYLSPTWTMINEDNEIQRSTVWRNFFGPLKSLWMSSNLVVFWSVSFRNGGLVIFLLIQTSQLLSSNLSDKLTPQIAPVFDVLTRSRKFTWPVLLCQT